MSDGLPSGLCAASILEKPRTMRRLSFIRAPFFWSMAVLVAGLRGLFAEAPPQADPRYVVIDLGPQIIWPVKISDANVVLGHDEKDNWYTWSDGTLSPLQGPHVPTSPAPAIRDLKLPQPQGASILPLKKVQNVPSLWDRKRVPAAQQSTTQVVGNGPDGAYLWEREHASDKTFHRLVSINLLVPQDSVGVPWNITSVADMNNGGAMVGSAIYTRTGPTDPISPGPHGVLILPMAIVRETTPGSGDFTPMMDNGLDNNSFLPIYATESGAGKSETVKSDAFSAGIYGDLKGPIRATMIFTFKTRFDKSDTGTLSQTAGGSDVFEDKSSHVRVELHPWDAAPTNSDSLNLLLSDPKLDINGDSYLLQQVAPNSNKYEGVPSPLAVVLKAPLAPNAINTIGFGMEGAFETLTETAVNSHVFKAADGMTITITKYTTSPGGKMTLRISGAPLTNAWLQFTLQETSATSLQYSNFRRIITDVPVSTPATDGQGIFYIEMTGTRPMKVTVASGDSHTTVEAKPVRGRPHLLRTGKLVMIRNGDPFRARSITTIESAGSEIDLLMAGQTIVK